jgi:Cu+-exporting ATPase
LRGQTQFYFDTAAAIVTLVLAGKLIERTAEDRAAHSIGVLYRLMPKKVRLLSVAGERFVSIDALEPGQVFVVKAGERIPADGFVVEGETHADESLLSGEAAPVAKRVGYPVVSGSLNADGMIQVRAARTGDKSALSQIIRLVERALSSRAPIERTVDRVARVFVPAVVLLAIINFCRTACHARRHCRRHDARHHDPGDRQPLRAWVSHSVGDYGRRRFRFAGGSADQRQQRA